MGVNTANWKVCLLLSMIFPVGLFTSLRLAGIGGSPNVETITLSPVAWQFNRTSADTRIEDWLNTTYSDDAGQMNFSVELGKYEPPNSAMPKYSLTIGIRFTAIPLNRDFSIRNVLVTFGEDPQPSQIELLSVYLRFENLTLTDFSMGEQARVQLSGNGSQGGVHCQFSAYWFLPTLNNVTSQRQINFEIIYFNGTAYKRTVQPFDLTLLGS